ncbi:MAG: ATP synthase F1 subunit epsilon [Lachnospiraceae bacterium]|nr:ATP synthase F1 subunit epsilon [Lachnospiraceae bacterium]
MADENKMHLKVIAPERIFFEGDVDMIEFRTTEGFRGVYPGHVAETCIVAPGEFKIHINGEEKVAALHSGFLEIQPGEVSVLAEVIEWPEEIDIQRAERAKQRAERQIARYGSSMNLMRAELALQRSLLRLRMSNKDDK